MKGKKIFLGLILILTLTFVLASCGNDLNYSDEYRQVFYSGEKGKFVHTGNSIKIYEDYSYEELFKFEDEDKLLKGSYVESANHNVLHAELNIGDIRKFKTAYRTALLKAGYTKSEIDNIILPSVSSSTNLFRYKDYMFKIEAVFAAMVGEPEELGQLDGIYNVDGILNKKSSTIKLIRGEIFVEEIDEFGDKKFTKKIGVYELNGDLIAITPLDPNGEPDREETSRYLLADIVLPDSFVEDVNKDGMYNGNELIKPVKGAKVKVMIGCFYTTKDIK